MRGSILIKFGDWLFIIKIQIWDICHKEKDIKIGFVETAVII